MTVTVRFAPSPTGLLHLGNARTAAVNWLFARSHGGRFVLRIDDTDQERSEERFVDAIRQDLRWLGLAWDEEHRQSERASVYEAAFEKLRAGGRVYPCYETADELKAKREAQRAKGQPPRYDRAALGPGRCRPRPPRGRRAHAALALPPRRPPGGAHRPRQGPEVHRPAEPQRSGGAPRGRRRHLSLRLGRRRCGDGHHRRDPGRGPSGQYRRPARPDPGAGRAGARLRAICRSSSTSRAAR